MSGFLPDQPSALASAQPSDLLPDIEDIAVVVFVLVVQHPLASLFADQHLCCGVARVLPEENLLHSRLRGIEMVGPALLPKDKGCHGEIARLLHLCYIP